MFPNTVMLKLHFDKKCNVLKKGRIKGKEILNEGPSEGREGPREGKEGLREEREGQREGKVKGKEGK